jgi:hypothetical protein
MGILVGVRLLLFLLPCMSTRVYARHLCNIRSNLNPSGEMAAEAACIPDP